MWSSFTTKKDKKGKKGKAIVEEPVKVSSPVSSYRKSNLIHRIGRRKEGGTRTRGRRYVELLHY